MKGFSMTSNLTNDMTRLCGQIAALRDSRADLMSHLAEARAEMQAAVSQMVGGFGEARSEMAKQTKAELGGFVARVKETVTELRQKVTELQDEFREDLAGAHRAWHGASPAPTVLKASFRAEEPSDELTPKARKKKKR
jgi:predicted  nucleic acid-binding Zn-ribbon protein